MRILVLRKQRRAFMSHYAAGKRKKKKKGRREVWGKGIWLRSAERVAILYLERTLFIATDSQPMTV